MQSEEIIIETVSASELPKSYSARTEFECESSCNGESRCESDRDIANCSEVDGDTNATNFIFHQIADRSTATPPWAQQEESVMAVDSITPQVTIIPRGNSQTTQASQIFRSYAESPNSKYMLPPINTTAQNMPCQCQLIPLKTPISDWCYYCHYRSINLGNVTWFNNLKMKCNNYRHTLFSLFRL